MSIVLTRVTFSNYRALGNRVNYFHCGLNLVLTKNRDCSTLRSVVNNTYSLGIF